MIRSLALVLGAPLAVLALGLGLVLQAQGDRASADRVEARLARALSQPRAEPIQRGAALLMPGETAGLAGAAFQAQVRALVQASGAELVQLESAPPEAAAPLTRLGLSLHLRGTEGQVAAFLSGLETAQPLIRAERLDLRGEGVEGGVLDGALDLSAWSAEVTP